MNTARVETERVVPTWSTGERYGVGTACDHRTEEPSRVWFTLTEGALAEPRFPSVDVLNFRTIEFLIVDSKADYAARTSRRRRPDAEDTLERSTEPATDDALVYRQQIRETAANRGWQLCLEYVTDPARDAILVDVTFEATDENQYDVYVVGGAAPSGYAGGTDAQSIGDRDGQALAAWEAGSEHTPVFQDEEGTPHEVASVLAADEPFEGALVTHESPARLAAALGAGQSPAAFDDELEASDEQVVLAGQLGAESQSVGQTVALGFAEEADVDAAAEIAVEAIDRGYEAARDAYVAGWQSSLEDHVLPASVRADDALANQYRTALMVLKAVADKAVPGASVASPSVPWGEAVDATEPGDYGYNFVWSRDQYQVFTALAAAGDLEDAIDCVEYLYEYQQREDGFLPQNTYVDGRTRWDGEQLDNIAFPAVMAYQLADEHEIAFTDVDYDYADVRRSIEYVLRSGPRSEQERWEEEDGYSPSTIAAAAAGLGCAAALADDVGERADALVYLAHADWWRRDVDQWCATETGTADHEQTPYYVRVTDEGDPDTETDRTLANNGPTLDERAIIDAGFLDLVRLGLRAPDDPIVENSVSVVDDTIRVETPNGPGWYRYNGDGYGEVGSDGPDHEPGAPWQLDRDGSSGRLWPLLTGERGEYELLAGTESGEHSPGNLLRTMQRFANSGRMIPEQVWDQADKTAYDWTVGEGTGAATPLAWSMAQYIRLAESIDTGEPVETPAILAHRYRDGPVAAPSLDVQHEIGADGVITCSGETDADEIVVWTASETTRVELTDGRFECSFRDPESLRVIAATDGEDLAGVGTTLERIV
jgi:glucan 1,4-alpha-glucosidase